jgi:hypothetical protein
LAALSIEPMVDQPGGRSQQSAILASRTASGNDTSALPKIADLGNLGFNETPSGVLCPPWAFG